MQNERFTESPKKEFSGSVYHVIPAQVFDDDRLNPNEKLFYGLVSGLTHRDGYCYAADKYLAERMKVEIRVIQDWLKKLERCGYVRRETIKKGMYWERKIYLTHSGVDSNNSYEQHRGATSNGPANSTTVQFGTAPKCYKNIEAINIESSSLLPPPTKPSKLPPSPPTKEEEEEIDRRLKRRPKDAPKITSHKKWKAKVLQDIRSESEADKKASLTVQNRRRTAKEHDGETVNGLRVTAFEDHVELSLGSAISKVCYDIPEKEWKRKTGWE